MAGAAERIDGTEAALTPVRVKGVIERDGRYLLALHNNRIPENKGKWTFLGGMIDPDDRSHEHTLIRELQEELQVAGRVHGQVGVFPYKGSGVVVLLASFDGEPQPDPDEILAVRWFTRHQIDGLAQAGLLHMGTEIDVLDVLDRATSLLGLYPKPWASDWRNAPRTIHGRPGSRMLLREHERCGRQGRGDRRRYAARGRRGRLRRGTGAGRQRRAARR